jgi:hypothetical protein
MSTYLYGEIFGESADTLAKRETEQRKLRKLTAAMDDFFQRGELACELGRRDLATPIDIREIQKQIGIETETRAPERSASVSKTERLERPLLIADRHGRAARALIAREIGKVRKTPTGEEVSTEAGLRAAWDTFSEYATGEQKSIAETAITQCDHGVMRALVRECMVKSEATL